MKFVLDTNIIFSGVYNLDSNAGKILLLATEGKIEIISLDHVKYELMEILEKKLRFSRDEVDEIISSLPINWIEEEIFIDEIERASRMISHKRDVPVLACAISLGTDIISGDKHFQKIKTRKIKIWKLKKALDEFK